MRIICTRPDPASSCNTHHRADPRMRHMYVCQASVDGLDSVRSRSWVTGSCGSPGDILLATDFGGNY